MDMTRRRFIRNGRHRGRSPDVGDRRRGCASQGATRATAPRQTSRARDLDRRRAGSDVPPLLEYRALGTQ
mgnify:CR=1 FL=1